VGDEELLATSAQVVETLDWRGGLEVEFIKESESGRIYVAEINPRFPAWIYLATGAGQNLPWAYVRLALGHEVEPLPPYRVGTQFVRISLDQVQDLSTYGALSAGGRFQSGGGRSSAP
jgi:carbamoyl-phosphate synthase large subunit